MIRHEPSPYLTRGDEKTFNPDLACSIASISSIHPAGANGVSPGHKEADPITDRDVSRVYPDCHRSLSFLITSDRSRPLRTTSDHFRRHAVQQKTSDNPFRSLYDPAFAEPPADLDAWGDFVAIVRHLRRDCPWDREQTHESVKHLMIEETFEAVDAIDRKDLDDLPAELGDVLLHVVFHAAIAEGDGTFGLRDIIEAISEKLVRRHPHVFGETEVAGVDEVLANWEEIKLTEGRRRSVLDGVPRALPSLLRAHRIQEKVAGVGFDFAAPDAAWKKVEEEIREFRDTEGADTSTREDELGDVLFSIVNYARLSGMTPENALRATCNKFEDRFRAVEETLERQGKSAASATLEEMDAIWENVKRSDS